MMTMICRFDLEIDNMYEYVTNLFAAQLALHDDEVMELIYDDYDVEQSMRTMKS